MVDVPPTLEPSRGSARNAVNTDSPAKQALQQALVQNHIIMIAEHIRNVIEDNRSDKAHGILATGTNFIHCRHSALCLVLIP